MLLFSTMSASPHPHVSAYYSVVFSRLNPGVFKLVHLPNDKFSTPNTWWLRWPRHQYRIFFYFTSSYAVLLASFSCCCLDPLSSTFSLCSAASRCSARLCCSCPNYTLIKVGSCLLLESQGASYYLSDKNFFPHEVRGCCSGWALGLLWARRPENQWLPIYSILLNSEFSPMPAVATLPHVSLCCRTPLSQVWGSPGVWQEGSHWRSNP